MDSVHPASDPPAAAGHTRQLAAYAADLRFEDLPRDVVDRVKMTLLDTLGVCVAALRSPDAAPLLDGALEFAADGPCSVPGSGRKTAPAPAALVWGTLSDIYELQDGWRFGGIHACLVMAAALPVAQWRKAGGRDLITAIVAGYEVAHRVAWAVHPEHMGRGHMPNGTAGTVGSAAAAARLLGADAAAFAGALGTAAFLLPFSTAETLWAGHSAKPLHTGWAARTGIETALLARRGFWGCPLEGSPAQGRGFLQLAADSARPDRLTEGLGTLFTLRDTYFKFYPICRQAQSVAEAALTIAREEAYSPADIQAVTVHTWDLSARMLTRTIDASANRIAAQFSLPYIVAATLSDRAMGVAQLAPERLRDPGLHALGQRVRVVSDPEMTRAYPEETHARVEVELADGRLLTRTVSTPKGDPRVPVTPADIEEKFAALCEGILSPTDQARLKQAVATLDDSPTLDALFAPLERLRLV